MALQDTQKPHFKLISLNIEREKHLALVIPFLKHEDPDVICLQEAFENDLPQFERELGMHSYYAPITLYPRATANAEPEVEGVAILTKQPLSDIKKDYYVTGGRAPGELVVFNKDTDSTAQRVLLTGTLQAGDTTFRIGTTHFTCSPDGQADDYQRRDIVQLLDILNGFDDIVFCGDFNAPRGREISNKLASHYMGWVPPDATTTLDQNLHRVKGLQLVVDGLFSTNHYRVTDTRVVDGVSDHCALVGQVGLSNASSLSVANAKKNLAVA